MIRGRVPVDATALAFRLSSGKQKKQKGGNVNLEPKRKIHEVKISAMSGLNLQLSVKEKTTNTRRLNFHQRRCQN